jgi:hypothetical protein
MNLFWVSKPLAQEKLEFITEDNIRNGGKFCNSLRLIGSCKKFKALIEEHNSICNDIKLHNKFWKYYSFAITYTLIPINLMTLQQVFFEDIIIPILILAIIFLVVFSSSQVMLNSITASINKEASISYKILIRLNLDSNSYIKFKDRIKVEQN